ncbi:cytochrome P450 [Aaosphaeria arxii CBS 175.79]|uniref:Cytochrome P450 n=1 Tax=Aaosphaeria arxii CBS 175.79 TaxID=1450172 RepID=A0A6A5XG67_9PLEO|nr:cytochrome P450 [Aaosphaeria arxii CBS 175.79]KAF2011846.1 cytochrome P450 [Aaosphaeria arxii CBS 175.79]
MAYLNWLLGEDTRTQVGNVIIILCLYPITNWIYNLYFHPLANFPGPILWRASRLPHMRAVWGKHFPYEIKKLHAQYGGVVRIAPNELSFSEAAAWDDIYSNTDGANPKAFKKGEIWHGNLEPGPSSVFTTIDFKEHGRIRKFMDPAFSERAVLQQEPIIRKHVDTCINKLRSRPSRTVNIVDWFNFTLFDIIGDLCFGESFNCLDKCEFEPWMDQMAASIKLNYQSINIRHFPIVNWLLKPLGGFLIPKEIIKQHMDYRQRSTEKLERALRSNDTDRQDIVSQLLKSNERSEGLTHEEVLLNSMQFINAASETTATTLTGVINHLLVNLDSLSKLEAEVRQFTSSAEMTLQALKPLPYLNAVLNEALRMCSSIPIGYMRVSPPEGGIVAGNYVPGNTIVTVLPVAVSFSPKYFYEPESWHPERWLPEAETDPKSPFYHDHRKAVRGFGWGPYNCIGEPLGWAAMRLILAQMLWAYNLKKAETPHSKIIWHEQDCFGIIIKHRLDVILADRIA